MIQWKVCQSWKQKWKNQPITRSWIEHCHWFILPLLLVTLTKEFSLDHKLQSHKRNQCSASDSVGLIFTRSYHSTLLITTPTMTPSLVQIQLQCIILFIRFPAWRLNWIRKLNRTFPSLPIPFTTPLLMIQWKLGCFPLCQRDRSTISGNTWGKLNGTTFSN